MKARHHLIALAALTAIAAPALAQTAAAPAAGATPQRIEVTGSLIKRTDTATPSVVQSFGREEITRSGYTTIEELLRSTGAVDTGSIGDAAASGFVGGLSTISLRGFGSQATLVLINGRRTAPVAAVDINFGRGSLISVNTIPKGAIDRIDVLKDGASAMYGSDAMAGVINYVLRKDYQGAEASVGYTTNDRGRGTTKTADLTFGFGNIDTQRFNVFGGLSYSKRDPVMFRDLVDRGNQAGYDAYLTSTGSLARFTPDSTASFYGNYYRVPASLTGSTTINGISVANNNLSGVNYLGTLPGCPAENTVGQGVPNRPAGFASTTASLPNGMCRFNFDNSDEAIAEQDRFNATVRGTFAISNSLTAYADLMYSQTKTNEQRTPYAMTTTLFTTATQTSATTWPLLNGSFRSQPAIVLPATHPDNPTRGTATAQPIQLIYRFEDLPRGDINTLKSLRLTAGLEGSLGAWDFDTAVLYSKQDNTREQEGRVRASLLTAAIANQTYRFGKPNTPEGIASVSSTATNEGESSITSLDFRASRELFKMSGGMAAVALGVEARREELTASSDPNYFAGDYIGLVANGASGSRTTFAAFGELSMPVLQSLEVQAALRAEKYSDFGNATTGKLGFKWTPMKGMLAFRGTAATGFRAPAISQISEAFSLSFHSFGERRIIDSLRCDPATNFTIGSPATNLRVNRDCNVLGYTPVPAGTVNPGSIPTVVGGNPNVKAETSRSFTFGLLLEPTKEIDLGIDMWYFHRDDEIRVQRGADIMDAYNANPTAPAPQITRDPNTATWLKDANGNPTATNTGPIILLTRQYGNFEWTKTAGVDYDLNVRLPATDFGKFSIKLQGTYTKRFDRLVLAGAPVDRWVGTSNSDIAKTRASLTLRWNAGSFNSFIRHNHTDPISTSTSAACLNSPAASLSAAQQQLKAAGRCKVGHERTVDMGITYDGIKNLSFTGTVFNLMNDYNRSNGIPSAFTYWDPGLNGALGRRFSLSATYKFF